jgi:hypothetical protein
MSYTEPKTALKMQQRMSWLKVSPFESEELCFVNGPAMSLWIEREEWILAEHPLLQQSLKSCCFKSHIEADTTESVVPPSKYDIREVGSGAKNGTDVMKQAPPTHE